MQRTTATNARKKDAHKKCALGGLIVKAGLRFEKRALLLGALIELGRRLKADPGKRERLMTIGAEAFGDDGD
ncbi:conjugal transfer protein TraD [Rhizobium sp. BK251]|uniref:conjugal transfer protein TraD n=1 Tax=Rhizobium sp. BK251 TaxID=2512125 RepID=UPI001048AB28|nr:conjugal transfer protein TraD [Rhizobium sp. BK251]TCL66355.1 conjugative transfer protein TraD [Rhizobium sp. BK251]